MGNHNEGNQPAGAHVIFHRLLKASKRQSIQVVLLCKRTQDAPIHPGLWALFGGTVNSGENPEDTVLREIKEELEICDKEKYPKISNFRKLDPVPIGREDGKRLIAYYSCLLEVDMDKLRLIKRSGKKIEGEGLAWFTAEEIHHLTVRPEDRVAINKFFKESGV